MNNPEANPRKSDRAIAVDLGIGNKTVSRAREELGVAGATPEREGRDGKVYRLPEPTPEQRLEYALVAMRNVVRRAQLLQSQAEMIGMSLKQGIISPRAALRWASDCALFDLVPSEEIEAATARAKETEA